MPRSLRMVLLALICAVSVWSFVRTETARSPAPQVPTPSSAPSSTPYAPPAPPTAPSARTVGFRSTARLVEHFEKHGGEFGADSPAQYLRLAQQLRDAPAGGDILEVVRPSDRVVSRFDRGSGAFLAADPDGTIRTFFKPNDGEAYFRRQARRSPRS